MLNSDVRSIKSVDLVRLIERYNLRKKDIIIGLEIEAIRFEKLQIELEEIKHILIKIMQHAQSEDKDWFEKNALNIQAELQWIDENLTKQNQVQLHELNVPVSLFFKPISASTDIAPFNYFRSAIQQTIEIFQRNIGSMFNIMNSYIDEKFHGKISYVEAMKNIVTSLPDLSEDELFLLNDGISYQEQLIKNKDSDYTNEYLLNNFGDWKNAPKVLSNY